MALEVRPAVDRDPVPPETTVASVDDSPWSLWVPDQRSPVTQPGKEIARKRLSGLDLYGGQPLATLDEDVDLVPRRVSPEVQIRLELERAGRPTGEGDLLIASIARSQAMTVVTHNQRELSRVPGLSLEDWA